jgi:tetratricopeptide (TPR) repeat protein
MTVMKIQSSIAAVYALIALGAAVASSASAAPMYSGGEKSDTIVQDPTSKEIQSGTRALERNDLQAAADHFQRALATDGKRIGALLGLAEAMARQGKTEISDALLQRALQTAPSSAEVKTAFGRAAFARGQLDRAIKDFEAAIALDGSFLPAWLDLGEATLSAARASVAEGAFRRAVAIDPMRASAYFGLGRALAAQGNRAAAIKALERATQIDPKRTQPWIAIAELHAADKRWPDAQRAINEARKIEPSNPSAAVAMADLLAASGKRIEAATEYAKVGAQFPEWPEPLIRKGSLHQQDGDITAAEAAYRDAVRRNEAASAVAQNNLAFIMAAANRNLDEALKLALRATALNPREPRFFGTLAQVHKARGERDAEQAAANKAQALLAKR